MKGSRILALATFCFAAVFLASSSDELQQGMALMAKAVDLENLRAQGAKSFHLSMKIHARQVGSDPADGSYDETWISPDIWRREITFRDFHQLEVGDSNSKWVSRNLDFRPRVASLTAAAIETFMRPDLMPEERILSVHGKTRNGIALQCIQVRKEHSRDRQLCFESSGALVSHERGNQRIEYEGYRRAGDKVLPSEIIFFEDGNRVLSIDVGELDSVNDPVPQFFERSADAKEFAPCERWLEEATTKVPPRYPEDARRAHDEGTVVLYVLLKADGRVQRLRVIRGVTKSLDLATLDSVRQWVYPPAHCGTAGLQSETEVQVNYKLQ